MTIDIMMPFYGRIDHFQEAVRSVLAQDDDRWRLVIVDDVYPDLAPGEWAQAIDDPRVEYHRNEVNLRPSLNYRKCVSMMQTEFAVIMGCDDRMLPGFVRRAHELVEQHPGAALLQPGVQVIADGGEVHLPTADRVKGWYRPDTDGPVELGGDVLARSLLRANWTYFPSLCWRVSELQQREFRADLDVVQDLAMILDIVIAGGTLVLDDEVVFEYRRHAGSVSAVTGPDGTKFAQERVLFAEMRDAMRDHGWNRASRAARWHSTSRLNALSEVPSAVRLRDRDGLRSLLRHAFGPVP
ncbi:glycosyltransferase family 2 protein [Aeromicrobium alkaliterrae]|uniref:Glycosyltransferase 2-like domain-containing protein n=1 Tax=Aeromicrobium alkaliterrae TaxID=302168 RepID=A0ABN2JE71_9ACTN